MDNASLRAVPGQRWQAVLYLDNNSGNPVEPVIECRFTNGGNPVMATRAMVQQTAPSIARDWSSKVRGSTFSSTVCRVR